MRNTRTIVALICVTTLTLCAGVVAGILAGHLPARDVAALSDPTTVSLSASLDLSPSQHDQLLEIWKQTRLDVLESYRDSQRAESSRDQAIRALLTDAQTAEYEKICKSHANSLETFAERRDERLQSAVEQTKALLNDRQRKKYDVILKHRLEHVPSTNPLGMVFPAGAGMQSMLD